MCVEQGDALAQPKLEQAPDNAEFLDANAETSEGREDENDQAKDNPHQGSDHAAGRGKPGDTDQPREGQIGKPFGADGPSWEVPIELQWQLILN